MNHCIFAFINPLVELRRPFLLLAHSNLGLSWEQRAKDAKAWKLNALQVDVIEGSRIYIPAIYVINKIDQITLEELNVISKLPHYCPVCAYLEWNLDGLVDMIWDYLDLIRVYTKPKVYSILLKSTLLVPVCHLTKHPELRFYLACLTFEAQVLLTAKSLWGKTWYAITTWYLL